MVMEQAMACEYGRLEQRMLGDEVQDPETGKRQVWRNNGCRAHKLVSVSETGTLYLILLT